MQRGKNNSDLNKVPDVLDVLSSFSQQFHSLMMNLGQHHNEEQQLNTQTHMNAEL